MSFFSVRFFFVVSLSTHYPYIIRLFRCSSQALATGAVALALGLAKVVLFLYLDAVGINSRNIISPFLIVFPVCFEFVCSKPTI